MKKYIHEIFSEVCGLENREDRISYLKEHGDSFEVKTVLQLCYNDKIVLDLPKGKPPFEECNIAKYPMSIIKAIKPIGSCIKGLERIPKIKKEKTFITILESVHPDDAAIIVAAKDGTITNLQNKKYRKITKALVQAAFPDLI